MKLQADPKKSGLSSLGLLPPLCLLVVAGSLLGVSLERQHGLRADASRARDGDNDGLVDAQELVLGTSISNADTDHDGFSDLEELARQTSPLSAQLYPDNGEDNSLGVGMSCYWLNGRIHTTIALYMPDQNLHDKTFRIGMLVGHHITMLPTDDLLARSRVETYPARDPNGMIMVVDFPLNPSVVHAHGHVTIFATSGYTETGRVKAADAAQLIDVGGVVVFCKVDHSPIAWWSNVSNGHQHASSSNLIYIPLGEDDGPVNWTPGSICYQQMEVVGTSGAAITQEVTSASCVDGWDGSCPPSCPDTVGSTSTTIDPLLLIGG
jgi:hypothetical protein